MALTLIKSLIILLLFHLVVNEDIPINSFEEIDVTKGTNNYSYQFIESNIPNGKDGYFYFKFKDSKDIQLYIIEENGNKNNVKIDNVYWLCYNITNLQSQKFIFQIINENQNPYTSVIFIDSTKEVNLSLEEYINLNFESHSVQNRPPIPLILNLNISEEEEGLYYFKEIEDDDESELYDADYLLYYCEIEENKKCNFIGFQSLFFEKNKKYKIKQNIYQKNERFYFTPFNIVKEIEFGKLEFTQKGNLNYYRYYFLNIEEIEVFDYFYIYSNTECFVGYMDENDKKQLPGIIDEITFFKHSKGISAILNDEYKYCIFKIKDDNKNVIMYLFNDIYEINSDLNLIVGGGENSLIIIKGEKYNKKKSYLASSYKNLAIIDSNFEPKNFKNILFFDSIDKNIYIYVDSKEKSYVKYFTYYTSPNQYSLFNIIDDENLNNYLNIYGGDSMFFRGISSNSSYIFNSTYFFNINEKYYLYIKKYYGFMDIYKYNQELNLFYNFTQFYNFSHSYENENEYQLINNKLIIINGFQLYTFTINYNSLFDFYIQKVEDFEDIQLNSEIFQFNNLVKLLNENKNYNLNFTVDHLVKLDNKFLDAEITFTDKEDNKYYLNKNQRIITHLKGDNIKVISTKNALIYFYKKIPNYSEEGTIIFDREQKRKNMNFNIENINNENINILIVKDFGFKGYYPLLSSKYWDKVVTKDSSTTTIYIENYYDKSDNEIYEGEDYIIYLFDSFDENNFPIFNSQNYKIGKSEYINNLLSPGNKYNFQVIDGNSNGSIILNLNEVPYIRYQFFMCNSENLEFKIENSFRYFKYENYPCEKTFKNNDDMSLSLNNYEALSHTFKSDKEFLFLFNTISHSQNNYKTDYDIISIDEIEKNKLIIKFKTPSGLNRLYIIIAKKDEFNNYKSFSDICHTAKLLTQNSNNIVMKSIYEENDNVFESNIGVTTIDISKINPKENEELVITIIAEKPFSNRMMEIFTPKEFIVEKKEVIEIKPEEEIKFYLNNKKIYKFDYKQEINNEQLLTFYSESFDSFSIILFSFITEKVEILTFDRLYENNFKLQKSGTYYIELYTDNDFLGDRNYIFKIYISGNIIDTIDLSERMYYKNINIISSTMQNPSIYKVSNLKNDTLVYFSYKALENPFEICDDSVGGACSKKVEFYKFLKDNNYTIYINFVSNYASEYTFNSYFFFPIFEDTLEKINKGYYISYVPKIYIINYVDKERLFYIAENTNNKLIKETNEEITLSNLINNHFIQLIGNILNENKRYINGLLMVIPEISENPAKIIITKNNLKYNKPGEYSLHSGENAIINFHINNDNFEDEDESQNYTNPLGLYNYLSIITSSIKNLKLICKFEEKEYKNFVIQNYFDYPIYMEQSETNETLKIKTYEPRYSFFIVADNNLFKLYWPKLDEMFKLSSFYKLNDFRSLRFVVNSDMHTFYEFFNFYFYDIKGNKNFYIKQYYGNTELYEYNPEFIIDKDYSILTKPRDINIENKTSILNKMINLKNNKLIFGYLGQNSLLDIYYEIDDNSTEIKLTHNMAKYFRSTAKYLKNGIEYSLEFEADHLAKLEPGFNAKISIYNNKGNEIILTPENPTGKFKGNNFKVKSNNDAMIYFYGKLRENFKQVKIDPEQVGKNFELKTDEFINYIISFSFDGFAPTENINYLNGSSVLQNGGNIYIENVYDKIKTKLVNGEYLYLYHISYGKVDIKYSQNLNHQNNIYSFLMIPSNSTDKTLIINNGKKEKIRYQINYCESPHLIEMYYQDSESKDEKTIIFNNETKFIDYKIGPKAHKLRFNSTNDFVFSYSFIDYTDEKIYDFKRFNNEREVLNNLTIENITKKYHDDNTSDIFTIKFKPNYKKSSTRYIIVIAPNEGTNTLENFKNPCYLIKLATNNISRSKNINIVDIGENDSIEINVDIHDILGKTDKYIINIISQELRFEKKINFYEPEIFIHRECYDNCDYDKDDDDDKGNHNEEENEEEDKEEFPLVYIICIGIASFIILFILIFFIIRYIRKRKQNIDLNRETRNLSNEKLMQDI